MTTPTPNDLHATIGRALVAGATADDRRAARHACLTLAAAFGEPGEPLHAPGVAQPPSRIDPAQMMDFLSARLRTYIDDEGARIAAAEAAAEAAAAEAATPPPPREVSVVMPRRTPPSAPARARPAPPARDSLRIPLVPLPRKAP